MTANMTRRAVLGGMACAALAACARSGTSDGKLRAGDQRGGARVVLAGAGKLDDVPYEIEWSQFPNAAPLLEALNAGAIDTGFGSDSAFVFASGSGATIKAIGAQKVTGVGPVIVVRGDSPIRTLGDLAGKRVATPRGSVSHNHVLAALEAHDLPYDAVTFAFLSPSDGRAAFQNGAVDAWAIWDPNAAIAEKEGARILPGQEGIVQTYGLIFGGDGAIAGKRALLADYRQRLYAGWTWMTANREEYARMMHRETGLPLEILQIMVGRTARKPVPIDETLIAEQQRTADRYFRAGLVPARLDVRPSFDISFS